MFDFIILDFAIRSSKNGSCYRDLFIVIVNVNDFNNIRTAEDKSYAVFFVYAETVNAEMFWFQNFNIQTRMAGIA